MGQREWGGGGGSREGEGVEHYALDFAFAYYAVPQFPPPPPKLALEQGKDALNQQSNVKQNHSG